MFPSSRKARLFSGVAVGALLAAGGVIALAVVSSSPGVESAPNAHHPACGDLAKRYPSKLLGADRSEAGAPGVAVWGDSAVVLRCGLTPPRPTTDPCFVVNGVDWVLEQGKSKSGKKVLVTYGRNPAVEVTVADASPSAGDSLVDLGDAVKRIPQKSRCV
ncbi:DUF3515 domain-containing protein [Streptomyces sp. NPDC007100]|uniref:DUF3515 domain-containing protein n=1 Tax=Streptomyces sp. NPDC007100 TaxID=3155602 RepID=UPI0033C380CE